MIYAKINSDGSVSQFPYNPPELHIPQNTDDLPANVVEVDTATNKPNTSWDQVARYDSVVKTGETYAVTYTTSARFSDAESKLKGITALKKQKEQVNERQFAQKTKDLLDAYPAVERETWTQQRQEAEAYQADNTVSTPLLSTIATARGITVDALATKVLAKASDYDASYGELLGKYQKNREILASIDLEDDTTWDNIDNLVRL